PTLSQCSKLRSNLKNTFKSGLTVIDELLEDLPQIWNFCVNTRPIEGVTNFEEARQNTFES
ncbi:hypothetical protein RI543_000388, partial [Arxiozyma heterogenica]